MKKIRVLQCVNSLGIGGNPIFIMNYFRKLDKELFQIDFIIFEEKLDFYDEVKAAGSKVYIAPQRSYKGALKWISDAVYVYRVLKKYPYDLIHCHSCSFKGLFKGVVPSWFVKRTRIIAHSHNVGFPPKNIWDYYLRSVLKIIISAMTDYGFACSRAAGESKFTERFMASGNYRFIHNAIDLDRFVFDREKRSLLREKMKLQDKHVIGCVARLDFQKNMFLLLDIFLKYRALDDKGVLLLVGDGDDREELEKYAKRLGINEDIIFAGAVQNVEDYYNVMDLFTLVSKYEGLGIVVIEAQAMGLPCVVADTIPMEAVVTDLVKRVSLKTDLEDWAKIFYQKISGVSERENCHDAITERGYSLSSETIKMQRVYCRLKRKGKYDF